MQCVTYLCVLIFIAVSVDFADARKTFSTRRKSGGSNSRRGSSTSVNQKQPSPPVTPHKSDSVSTNFLNSERAGSSHSTVNTHHRGDPFKNNQEVPKQTVPQTNGPIGFEKLGNQGNQKLGFDKVNSEAQHKPLSSNVPSAPAHPAGSPPYPGGAALPAKPLANAPNGPPPAYPGYGTGSHSGGFEAPPAYPGRPVNAPPVYSANNPNYGHMNPAQSGFGSNSYQQGNHPHQQSYPGQQNFGYPNTGANFGNYPNQGYNQGFGSYQPNGGSHFGSYGQSYPGFGGNSYGGSPFGHSNPYGGSPFSSSGIGGNSFGGFGHNNPHYSPNNFGFSSNPGLFGSSGKYSNFGYHKKSRFGGLPIPIPIPIPLGMFGGFGGGHSHNHRLLDTFVKNKNISSTENTTTSVFILNNSTVTPCTTDQFIYDSLNVTVVSCTADNCTAVKLFTTTNVSGEISVHSAALTMCLEPNATYSSHAENVNPTVSDAHNYWMRLCKDVTGTNSTSNTTDHPGSVTTTVSEAIINGTDNSTTPTSPVSNNETTTLTHLHSKTYSFGLNNTNNFSICETLHCSWIEMCLPSIEIVNRCSSTDCPSTKTAYRPCIRIKMCKSPSTPISTIATLNTTISRIDQFNSATTVNDVANLTLISYVPPALPVNCSNNASSDPNCLPSLATLPQEVCAPSNSTEGSNGHASSTTSSSSSCTTPVVSDGSKSSDVNMPTTEVPSTTPTP